MIEKNTFAYNPARINVGSIGFSGDLNNIIISSLYVCFKSTKDVEDKFLLHFFATSGFTESVKNNTEGGIRSYLFYENFSRINIALPPKKEEQQKIADCLSSLDEVITAQTQKLGALKAHKKGLMQQLFPAEGETVPKLRFPEFQDKGEWKERSLSDVLSEHKQKATGTEEVFSVSVHKGLINQIEHLGRSFSASSTEHYNRVLPGDIVYTKSPTGDFPLGIIKQSKLDFPVIVSPLYGVFSPETIALGTMLDAYFESSANAKFYLEPLVQKGAKNTINVNNSKFLSGALILPLNKNEQQKIADCLSSIDKVITAQTQKLGALKAYKKGLMQKLFPAMDEVA